MVEVSINEFARPASSNQDRIIAASSKESLVQCVVDTVVAILYNQSTALETSLRLIVGLFNQVSNGHT